MRTRSRSRHKIAEPLRIEFHSQEDQFQEDPPEVPMADNQTMAQLLQAPIVGYEDAIFIPKIAATNFDVKHGLINLVQNKQFFGHDKEDSHAHIRYFNKITSTMRVPNVPNSTIKLMLFPFSIEWAVWIWLEKEPPRSILTWDDLVSKFINQACPHHGFSELHQLDTFYNALNVNDHDSLNSAAGSRCQSEFELFHLAISSDVDELKDMVRALLLDKKNQSSAPSPTPAPVKTVESNCVTCGGTHSYLNCPATSENVYQDNIHEYVSQAAAANYNQGNTSFCPQMVANQIRPPGFPPVQNNQNNFNRGNNFTQNRGGSGTLPGNTVTNPKEDLKGITTRSGVAYNRPTIPTPSKVVKQGTKVTKDQVQTPSSQSISHVQPPVTQSKTPVFEPIAAPVSASMPNLKPSIPYPLRRDNERRCEQANEQIKKFYEIFKVMSFENSFTDALILMPKFASTLKALTGNKEKLSEMARTPMNEYCSVVILNKLPKKLRDPDKFLIPCEFSGMDECLALADLGASINLMPLSVWKELSLPEVTPTCMTLDLTDRSVSKPIGIAKDVLVKVGMFHFPAEFMVVDFEPDPRVPLILAIIEPLRIENPFLQDQFQEDPPKDPPEVPMADDRTIAELLRAPTEGYEDVIVIPEITANNFELKHGLINLVQNKQFFVHDKEDPHAHIRYFNKITPTMRVPNVPSSSIKLMLFPFSLEVAARIWLKKEAPRSILTREDLVSKFINQFFPPSKMTNLRNEITRFQQRFDESFYEVWERFNDLLMACPHHGFSELHQLDTFYNALNVNDQDSLNSAADISSDVAELKDMVRALLLDKKNQSSALAPSLTPAPVKAVEPNCVTCGGMDECLALADLSASINLMPLSVWQGLSLSKLTLTCMTVKHADHSVSKPIGIAKDVSVNVETKPSLTIWIKLRDITVSGNPTPYDDPIVSTMSPTLTPFGDSDFLLFEEADAFLGLEDDPNLP
nr:reverse transcriptase domain-containing protein [Tanacetum cinerariifolium]